MRMASCPVWYGVTPRRARPGNSTAALDEYAAELVESLAGAGISDAPMVIGTFTPPLR